MEEEIRKELIGLREEKYKDFSSNLIPGCNNLLGVRIPEIRKIAKRIVKEGKAEEYLNIKDIYFEETMLQGLIIGNMKCDFKNILKQVKKFIPKISNWSLCDSFCNELKIIKKNKQEMWEFLEKYWKSNEKYEIRFSVVIILGYYIEEKYIQELFNIFDYIKNDKYYVKMAVAWAISICFVKYPKETMSYLKDNKLDNETYNKALQKIRESLRVDKETKEIIKGMKRENK